MASCELLIEALSASQRAGLRITELSSKDLGPQLALETGVEAFVETVDEALANTTPEGPRASQTRAFLTAARDGVKRIPTLPRMKRDPEKALRTLALIGPAIIIVADLLDAMIDENYEG